MAREIINSRIAENGHLVFEFNDGTTADLGRVRGRDGVDGADGVPGRDPADGADGVGIVSAEVDAAGDLVIGLSNNQLLIPGHVQGPPGQRGPAGPAGQDGPTGPTGPKGETGQGLSIKGTLDSEASLPITSNEGEAYLIAGDLWVWLASAWTNVGKIQGPEGPQGPVGPAGDDGAQGAKGDQGVPGLQGPIGPEGPQGPRGPTGATGQTGPSGADGDSAYQIALADGFVGTQSEWLVSLEGADGATGASAYEVALSQGYVGTEADWLNDQVGPQGPEGPQGPAGADGSDGAPGPEGPEGPQGPVGPALQILGELPSSADLPATGEPGDAFLIGGNLWTWNGTQWIDAGNIQGPIGPEGPEGPQGPQGPAGADGVDGTNGADGASAYESAVAGGFVGTEAEWRASLQGAEGPEGPQGPQGIQGPAGADGADGAPGADGASAYQVAVADGFAGTDSEWLATLVGPDGPEGPQGPVGPEGPEGPAGTTDYNELTNKPVIPTATSNLTNDSGFITLGDVPTEIPTGGTDGQVLTSDGIGGVGWEDASGGGSGLPAGGTEGQVLGIDFLSNPAWGLPKQTVQTHVNLNGYYTLDLAQANCFIITLSMYYGVILQTFDNASSYVGQHGFIQVTLAPNADVSFASTWLFPNGVLPTIVNNTTVDRTIIVEYFIGANGDVYGNVLRDMDSGTISGGANITVGATAPANPQTNDLWVDIS